MTNYKILVTMRMSGGYDGGRAAAIQLIEYENLQPAEIAYRQLYDARIPDVTVTKLWK